MPSTLIASLFCFSALWAASPVYSLALHPGGGNMIASRTTSYQCDNHIVTVLPDCHDEGPECECTTGYVSMLVHEDLCPLGEEMEQDPARFVSVRIELDDFLAFCHHEGYNVSYRLEMPPEAQRIYDGLLRQDANLRLQQKIFLALQLMGGHIGLVITILFTLFQSSHRDLTFFSFCITWIISSVVYSISLYKGTENHSLVSPLDSFFFPQEMRRCDIQAILVAGSQIMTAGSTMTLVLQLLLNLHSTIYAEPKDALKPRRWITLMLVALPYGGLAFGSLFSYLLVTKKSTSWQFGTPGTFYCMITDDIIVRTVYITTIFLHVVALIFDVLIGIILYRCWKAFQHKLTNKIPLDTLVRIIFFSIYRMVVIGAFATVAKFSIRSHMMSIGDSVGWAIEQAPPEWVDFLQATGPLVAFLVLGVNKDMVKALMFWKRKAAMIRE